MFMLLSVHATSILFLVRLNNFTLTTGFYWSYTVARSYALLVNLYIDVHVASLVSHTLHGERKGVVMLQLTRCLQETVVTAESCCDQ